MSIIPTYKEPSDLLHKLFREGNRVWVATDIIEKSDYFFNFCITSLSIRDWCIKYLNLTGKDKNTFFDLHSHDKYLSLCGSIANTSKHFTLDSSRSSSVDNIEEIQDNLTPIFPDGVWHEELQITRPSFSIISSDGKKEMLMVVLLQTYNSWISIFNAKDIDTKNAPNGAYMFVEMYYPSLSKN